MTQFNEADLEDTPETAPPIPRTQKSMDAAKAREMRDSPQFKAMRLDFRAEGARQRNPDGSAGAPCWLCGGDIEYCVAPDTLVLCADLAWRRADQLLAGEEVIAFDEWPQRTEDGGHHYRKFRRATIEGKARLTAPCLRIATDDGSTVVCSTEHRWLILSGKTLRWKSAQRLELGDTLITIGQPWVEAMDKEAGYLAGIFDGEGSLSGRSRQLNFSQLPGPVLERAIQALKELDVAHACYVRPKDGVVTVTIRSGVWEAIRTLGCVRPVRLLGQADRLWDGAAVSRSGAIKTRITAIDRLGEREVIGLRTSAATFIANGLLSHNSLKYPHPYSWSLDHAVTVKERPDLLMDRENFRHSHHDCNQIRGTDEPSIDIGQPSEAW